jgi:RimJ/RimL family protein N-acetyltransferase
MEGRLRESWQFNRRWYDEVLLSMKEGDWEKLRGIATSCDTRA